MTLNLTASIQINESTLLNKHVSNPEFPFLISFPRTGSHWLRMLMELYFEKPALVRCFYYRNAQEFTCIHKHDLDLTIERQAVIYLYRNPIDTIYSQLRYYNENLNDVLRIEYWADSYGRHLSKWLFEEKFTTKKISLTYEGLVNSIDQEFQKLCKFFGISFDHSKLRQAIKLVSKREVQKKTQHDAQVINLSKAYEIHREYFTKTYGNLVMNMVLEKNHLLKHIFT